MIVIESVALQRQSITRAFAITMVSVTLLAACSPAATNTQAHADVAGVGKTPMAASEVAPQATTPAPAAAAGTVGGDGSDIRLDPLTDADIAGATLTGELACGFSTDGTQPLLLAKGVVASDDPAQGVVKVAGYVEAVRAPGGFDAMAKNPTFTGQGKTIRIEQTGAAIGGGESPPRPATLTYQRADGASRTFAGRWQCGP